MRTAPPFSQGVRLAAVAALILGLLPSCSKPAARLSGSPKPAVNTNSAPADPVRVANASVFENLMPPKGRDPFFPNSRRRDPVSIPSVPGIKATEAADLVLKGVVGPLNRRMAVINSAILEVNENGSVGLPSGRHARVRCLEIGENYAVIKVDGELQPRRLELTKKEFRLNGP